MYTSVNLSSFRDNFRQVRPNNFSYKGLECLYEYLTQLEVETGQEIELDVIAICCDFTESTIEEVLNDYNLESIEDLELNTTVIYVDEDTVIYQNY